MTLEEIRDIKSKVFVYHIKPFESFGIYIGESKDEAIKSIYSEIWDDVDYSIFFPSEEEKRDRLRDMFDNRVTEAQIESLIESGNKHPINVYESIEIWTWEEYQDIQGFKVSDRLLEIIS